MQFDPATEFRQAAQDECLIVANEILAEIKRPGGRTPVKTGRLINGYRVEAVAGGAEIVTDVEYWASVEFGSLPHDIPNAWGTGNTVHHPGGHAQPHVRPAIELVAQRRSG